MKLSKKSVQICKKLDKDQKENTEQNQETKNQKFT